MNEIGGGDFVFRFKGATLRIRNVNIFYVRAIRTRSLDIDPNFEPISTRLARLMWVHIGMNSIVFEKNWPNITTDMTEKGPLLKRFSRKVVPFSIYQKKQLFATGTVFQPEGNFFSDTSKGNNDYSDTLGFKRSWLVVTFSLLEVPDNKSSMLIYVYLHKDAFTLANKTLANKRDE